MVSPLQPGGWPCLDAVQAMPQGPLGSLEHMGTPVKQVLSDVPSSPNSALVEKLERAARPSLWGPGLFLVCVGEWTRQEAERKDKGFWVPLAFIPLS